MLVVDRFMHYTVFGFLATTRQREGFIRTLGGRVEDKHIRFTNKKNTVRLKQLRYCYALKSVYCGRQLITKCIHRQAVIAVK
jgi:hypothetical protein